MYSPPFVSVMTFDPLCQLNTDNVKLTAELCWLTCVVRPRRSWPRGIAPCGSWCRSPALCTGSPTPALNRCKSDGGKTQRHDSLPKKEQTLRQTLDSSLSQLQRYQHLHWLIMIIMMITEKYKKICWPMVDTIIWQPVKMFVLKLLKLHTV